MKKFFLPTIAALGALVGFSELATAAAGWTSSGVVGDLAQQPTTGSQATMVTFSMSATFNPSNCSATTLYYFAVGDDRAKRIFTMLVAAQAQGRSVKLYVTGNCDPSGISMVDGVQID